MADPDIRRMGKKHKKHKKEYSQYHNIRLPGFLPERVPMPEEPVNEMKVVLKLPRPMENHNGRLRFTSPIITQHRHGHRDVHHNRPSWGSGLTTIPPRELIVSIPFTALYQQEEEEEPLEPEAEPVAAIADLEGEQLHHSSSSSSHHKHKKHKKHKIKKHHHHHQHDSAPQEEVKGRFGGPETAYPPMVDVIKHEPSSSLRSMAQLAPIEGTIKTVAPLKIQVPKPSPPLADATSGRTLSKHKTHSHSHAHHEESSVLVSERHGQPPPAPGALPSGKHMHTTTHKHHHHKHKEKRHHHHHKSSGYQGDEHVTGYRGNEDILGGGGGGGDDDIDNDDDFNEQGQAVVMRIAPPIRPPGGKPTAFMKTVEEKKKFTSNEYSPIGGSSEKIQTSSHEGHKHHKKKKKKHHKHSKHSFSHSEPEVSPPIARLSESEASQLGPGRQFIATTPLSTGGGTGRSTTTTAQAHAHPVAIPQEMPVASREPTFTRSPSKDGKKLIQDGGLLSFRETRRSSQDSGSGSSGHLPLRRLSEDKRTPKKLEAQSPDVLPPPAKRSRMDDEKPPLPPSLKFDISQTKGLDFDLRDTPSSPATTGAQFEPLSLRHQTSHESSDSVASTPVMVAKSSTLGEARRSSVGAAAMGGGGGGGERAQLQSTSAASPPVMQNPAEMKTAQVRLSKDTLQLFLKNLHHLIQRRDPDGIFAEPVTDDIAPGYSALISIPMDLATVAKKIDMGQYESVGDFKSDFILMCNNAMTYNAPETVYYASAKRLLTTGLQIIAKETSLRPDIRHGTTALIPSRSVSPAPLPSDTPPVNIKVDYSSPFLCRVDLALLRGTSGAVTRSAGGATSGLMMGGVLGGLTLPSEQPECISVDVNGLSDITNQSHLTKVVIGFEDEVKETSMAAAGGGEDELEPEEDVFSSLAPESPEEILAQVEEAAELMKENLDSSNRANVKFTFLNQDESGKTMLNVLNPDTGSVDVSSPLDLTTLNDFVRMGNNAATVLKTELPLMRATPVSYLMYGPFGSFAPAYDSSFATLTKMDSDLLLQSYGSELGVSYAHSLQQFVKGSGSFVTEMADAVLNGLTNNRHSKFMAKFREFEERERKLRETPASTSASLSRDGSVDDETEKSPTSAKEEGEGMEKSPTSVKEKEESTTPVEGTGKKTAGGPEESMDTSEPAAQQDSASKQGSITSDDSRGSPLEEETPLHHDNNTHNDTTIAPPLPPALPPQEGSEDSNNSSFDKNTSEDRRNSSDSVGSSPPKGKPLPSGVVEGEGEGEEVSSLSGEACAGVEGGDLKVASLERSSSSTTTTTTSSSSNSSSTPATPPLPLPLPLAVSAAPGGTEPVDEEDEPMEEEGKIDVGGEFDEEAAILLGDLEDIGSLGSPSEEGAPVISGATSENNSRLTSPASVEPLQKLDLIDQAPLDADIDSQLEQTSHLLGQLEEEQRDRLSQAPLELDDGHLVLPGPSDEEVRIASDLRAGLAQLTAQARPRDFVSVPALHDAMGISIETVAPKEEEESGGGPREGEGEKETETESQQQGQVDSTQTTTTATATTMTGDNNNETESSNQQ